MADNTKRSPFFTKENASEYARRGNLIRWHRPKSLPEPNSELPPIATPNTAKITTQTFEHIQACFKRLTDAPDMPPDELDAITRSMERLWKIHAHAGQIAQPAHIKQERRRRQDAIELEPAFTLLPEPAQSSPMATSQVAQPSVAATSQGMSYKDQVSPVIESAPIIEVIATPIVPSPTTPTVTSTAPLSAQAIANLLKP